MTVTVGSLWFGRSHLLFVHSKVSMSRVRDRDVGDVHGLYRSTTSPFRSTKYLLKFQLGLPFCCIRCWNIGCALSPLTSMVWLIKKVTPKLKRQILAASSSFIAAWLKALLGKPIMTRSWSLYSWCNSSKSPNWLVKPQWLAVLTSNSGLPAVAAHKSNGMPEWSCLRSCLSHGAHDAKADCEADRPMNRPNKTCIT